MNLTKTFGSICLALGIVAGAQAADVNVTSNITTSETWSASNVYILQDVIYVEPGATLTIEPGTVIRGNGADASVVITVGAKIIANGTAQDPIIFTSVNDTTTGVAYPTGTGFRPAWEATCQEWGNLVILGDGIISATTDGQGSGNPDGNDTSQMEGLSAAGSLPIYGGNNDNHDGGSIKYVQLRYGGFTLTTANELNGLSLGGVGRETDIAFIEIMNNKDDGIEIWGGTVGLKYVCIWNIGDDSFDLDQGYRGKAQFVLIVQGYCDPSGGQESGVGDRALEMDGAESREAQPFCAPQLYNFTVIGNPGDLFPGSRQGTAWRDNMRAQIGNSIFAELGGDVIGGIGTYPADSPFNDLLTRPVTTFSANELGELAAAGVTGADIYGLTSGTWIQFTDCIFYKKAAGDTSPTTYGQMAAGKNNIDEPASSPFAGGDPTRAAAVTVGGNDIVRVTSIDPRAANAAATSVGTAPNDGFFSPVPFIGAFSPSVNWALGWTVADTYGFFSSPANPANPSVTVDVTALTSFPTTNGVIYTIECSTNGVNWEVVDSIVGDGSTMKVADLDGFDGAKLYRVIVQ